MPTSLFCIARGSYIACNYILTKKRIKIKFQKFLPAGRKNK